MATHVGTTGMHGAARHFTLVSVDLGRFRAIRSRRYLTLLVLTTTLALSAGAVAAIVAYLGAPAWLAGTIGILCAVLVPLRAGSAGQVGIHAHMEAA